MKWLRTVILFDKGEIVSTKDWADVHASYTRAISAIDFPRGSGQLRLRKKMRDPISKQWDRNGVGYLKSRFFEHLVDVEGWKPETEADLKDFREQPKLQLYPSLEPYQEPITSSFGEFDFTTTTPNGLRVAIEWETGNISSSHRSLNKLSIVLRRGQIHIGVLVLPSRDLYEHLTDRIGNIGELSPYLGIWHSMQSLIARGLLAVTVVEHDELTDDPEFPYMKVGSDGRAKQGKAKRR